MNPRLILPKVPLIRGRQEVILAECKGKRVLHLGCVDVGLTVERFDQNQMMHQKLARTAGELWGVDIDNGGIEFLREKGFTNLLTADICRLDQVRELQGRSFEVVVASEVVEHLNNPGLFLQAVKSVMLPGRTKLIVTVPNAFRVSTLLALLQGVEYVHPDHNYWFSFTTIRNLVQKNGFDILETMVYAFDEHRLFPPKAKHTHSASTESSVGQSLGPQKRTLMERISGRLRTFPKRLLLSFLYERTPFWGDGILLIAQLPDPASRLAGEMNRG
jgi:hypothetical protein